MVPFFKITCFPKKDFLSIFSLVMNYIQLMLKRTTQINISLYYGGLVILTSNLNVKSKGVSFHSTHGSSVCVAERWRIVIHKIRQDHRFDLFRINGIHSPIIRIRSTTSMKMSKFYSMSMNWLPSRSMKEKSPRLKTSLTNWSWKR